MTPLFGYGTFRRTAWRNAILGAEYPAQPATLAGYRRVALTTSAAYGYLSLRETVFALSLVEGVLVDLDAVGWEVADAWEEVPTYRRTEVVVNSMSGPVEALTYICSDTADARPVDADVLALISDADVEASIRAFAHRMRVIRRRNEPPD